MTTVSVLANVSCDRASAVPTRSSPATRLTFAGQPGQPSPGTNTGIPKEPLAMRSSRWLTVVTSGSVLCAKSLRGVASGGSGSAAPKPSTVRRATRSSLRGSLARSSSRLVRLVSPSSGHSEGSMMHSIGGASLGKKPPPATSRKPKPAMPSGTTRSRVTVCRGPPDCGCRSAIRVTTSPGSRKSSTICVEGIGSEPLIETPSASSARRSTSSSIAISTSSASIVTSSTGVPVTRARWSKSSKIDSNAMSKSLAQTFSRASVNGPVSAPSPVRT